MTKFNDATPILRVDDMQRSVRFYTEVLGFTLADWSTDDFGNVSRDRCHILLCHESQGQPGTFLYVSVADVDGLFEELKQTSADIVEEPTEKGYALEMTVKDPDGHHIRFGSEPRDFEG